MISLSPRISLSPVYKPPTHRAYGRMPCVPCRSSGRLAENASPRFATRYMVVQHGDGGNDSRRTFALHCVHNYRPHKLDQSNDEMSNWYTPPSPAPTASRVPSGEKLTEETAPRACENFTSPVDVSKILTVGLGVPPALSTTEPPAATSLPPDL